MYGYWLAPLVCFQALFGAMMELRRMVCKHHVLKHSTSASTSCCRFHSKAHFQIFLQAQFQDQLPLAPTV